VSQRVKIRWRADDQKLSFGMDFNNWVPSPFLPKGFEMTKSAGLIAYVTDA